MWFRHPITLSEHTPLAMPRSAHDAPASSGAKRPKPSKAVKSPAAAPAPAPVAVAAPVVAGGASSRGKGGFASAVAVAAVAAGKKPRTGGKGVLPAIKRRGKPETARAQRLRLAPISGVSDKRIKVLATQMGLVSLKSEAKRALRAIVAANVDYVLQQAIVRAACSRRHTVQTAHLTAAYAAANTHTHQLYLTREDEHAKADGGDRERRSVHKAIAACSAPKTHKRAAVVAADADEEMFAM